MSLRDCLAYHFTVSEASNQTLYIYPRNCTKIGCTFLVPVGFLISSLAIASFFFLENRSISQVSLGLGCVILFLGLGCGIGAFSPARVSFTSIAVNEMQPNQVSQSV